MIAAPAPFNHYEIDTDGRVYNTKTKTWLKAARLPAGYLLYSLSAPGKLHRNLYLHQAVLLGNGQQIPDGMQVDHVDGNRSNNSLANLRIVTASQNQANSARWRNKKGYSRTKSGMYTVKLRAEGSDYYLGVYKSEAVASAVVRAATRYYAKHQSYNGFDWRTIREISKQLV